MEVRATKYIALISILIIRIEKMLFLNNGLRELMGQVMCSQIMLRHLRFVENH